MRTLLLAILIGSPACAQTLNGLGFSSKTCVDLDGDGYGTGSLANLVTTASAAVVPGVQTVAIGATTGLVVGQRVRYDTGANLEFVTLTGVSGGTITGNFLAGHAAGVSVSAGTQGGTLFFPGYPTDDPGCLGLDADDRDATVHTAAQGIAKYGSLNAFLAKLGRDIQIYEADSAAGPAEASAVGALLSSPAHIYYLSPSGMDAAGCGTSTSAPCLTVSGLVTYAGYQNTGIGGDLILLRNGWNGRLTLYSGTATRFNGAMGYPGEHAVIDASSGGGQVLLQQTNCSATPNGTNYVFLDGLRLQNGAGISGGTIDTVSCPTQTTSDNHDVWIQHFEGTEGGPGGLATVTAFNGVNNWVVEYNALHDDNCSSNCNTPHGLYMGSDSIASSNTTIRRNLIYRNSWNGLHWNGTATGLFIDQNVVYDNGITGLDFEEGLSHSFIRGNLAFNNVKQMLFYNYPGSCQSQGTFNGNFQLCPGNEDYNLIENNTLYATGNADISYPGSNPDAGCPTGIFSCAQAPIQISNASSPLQGDMGNNTFRNNIIVAYGWNNRKPAIAFGDPTSNGTCGTMCQGWAQTSTFDHNLFWQSDGNGGTNVLLIASNEYTCATAVSVTAAFTNCTVADPQFIAESITAWNIESYFDLRLTTSSPALHAGSTTGIPNYDAVGRAYTESGPSSGPSMGALERNLYGQGWTTLTGAGLSPAVAPNTGDPNYTNCITPSGLNPAPCPPGGYPFPTQYTSEFTAWTDGIKREKAGAPKQLVWFGGGHADYIGNEIYAISLNLVTPSIARITGPSTFAAPGLTVFQTYDVPSTDPQPALADGSANTRHTPGNLAYNLTADKMGLFGGALAGGNGGHTYDTWEFNFGTNAWERYNSGTANTDDVDCSNHGTGYSVCGFAIGQQVDPIATFNGSFQGSNIYDPLTQSYWVYWGCAGGCSVLTQYYPTYHQHVVRATSQPALSGGATEGENSRVFISDRRWIFVTDWYNSTLRNWIIDISGATSQTPTSGPNPSMVAVTTDPSCNGLLQTPGPGLVYLPLQGRILGFPAATGGNTYYLMDPATWTCTSGTFSGGPATNPMNQYIIGKMQHFDSLDATLLVNDVGPNAPSVLNLSPGDPGGGSTQPPDGGGGGGTTPPPTVTITSPSSGATVTGSVILSATASGTLMIASVQFTVDGINVGSALTTTPYTVSWDSTTASIGTHAISAVVTDTGGNVGTAPGVIVTVSNPIGLPSTSGLSGYWNFNEDAGSVAHDSSGNGYNGTVSNATWVPGKILSALSFNGTTSSVITSSIPLTNTFSISAWVNAAVTTQQQFARIAETRYNTGLYLGTDSTGTKYKFIVNNGTGSTGGCGARYGCAQGGTVTSGWHLITGTFDGTTAILYVDNAVVATDTFTAPSSVAYPLNIGIYYTGSGYGWNGIIDEVRLYGRAITGAEVSAMYNYAGTAATCDLNDDGMVNVLDVQTAINQALDIVPCTNADLQQNGQCNAVDVQRVVNAALGGACVIGP